jgi:ABC-2 type transport system permease protein
MLGKFLAAWIFMALALLLTFPMVLTVMYLGSPDLGVIAAGYCGSLLMAGAFLAIGICVSATTSNQVISFVVATSISLIFVLLGFQPVVDALSRILPTFVSDQLVNLSFPYHFEGMQRGVITFSDLLYFVSVIAFCLLSGVVIIDRKRAD